MNCRSSSPRLLPTTWPNRTRPPTAQCVHTAPNLEERRSHFDATRRQPRPEVRCLSIMYRTSRSSKPCVLQAGEAIWTPLLAGHTVMDKEKAVRVVLLFDGA